jgi:hypothetical protein
MDIIWVFLLMALLYGLPELLRKKQRKTYDYPKVPKPSQLPETSIPIGRNEEVIAVEEFVGPKSKQAKDSSTVSSAQTFDESSVVTSAQVASGIVWAEILAKPKIVRPFGSFKPR